MVRAIFHLLSDIDEFVINMSKYHFKWQDNIFGKYLLWLLLKYNFICILVILETIGTDTDSYFWLNTWTSRKQVTILVLYDMTAKQNRGLVIPVQIKRLKTSVPQTEQGHRPLVWSEPTIV